ncbi:MarR family winged helix-turn-helix transcriptional regulator [Paenibacillus allorhizosphaerae]|uniref:Transcriptional regulator SlyA n=1 Tax=Paenibacillus allorhizosphaerae TaxID=2849866 RepID=A0ABN7TM45_9BACL|nr:MarR family transcriptional regulator [Paenibacillus allorhizosphaerae]CAG7646612.1 Transcriptional regulator SlyA [Paenibacillus allorhizosphaerae]
MSKQATNRSILDSSAGFLMGATYRKISQLFMQRLKPYDITPEQWLVLYCVGEQKGMIQKDIAAKASKDKPTTTRILDMLESKGLVIKQPGQSDRRSFIVHTTDKGKELIAQTEAIERKAVEDATAGMSTDEYNLLIGLLHRIGENIDHLNAKE